MKPNDYIVLSRFLRISSIVVPSQLKIAQSFVQGRGPALFIA